jgi:hypothetical protein
MLYYILVWSFVGLDSHPRYLPTDFGSKNETWRLGSITLANVPFSFSPVKRTRSELKNAKITSAKIEKINSAWSIPGCSSAESLDDARC